MKNKILLLSLLFSFSSFGQSTNLPSLSYNWMDKVATAADLPLTFNQIGDTREALDTLIIYSWNGSSWVIQTAGSGGSSISIGETIVSGTPNSVLFVSSASQLGQDPSNFYFDQTNKVFSVGFAGDPVILSDFNNAQFSFGDSTVSQNFLFLDGLTGIASLKMGGTQILSLNRPTNNYSFGDDLGTHNFFNLNGLTSIIKIGNNPYMSIDTVNKLYDFGDSQVNSDFFRVDGVSGLANLFVNGIRSMQIDNTNKLYTIGDDLTGQNYFGYNGVSQEFTVKYGGTEAMTVRPGIQAFIGDVNGTIFVANDTAQAFGFNTVNPQYVIDVGNNRQPIIQPTQVISGTGIDTPTSGGTYSLTTDANIFITIDQVDLTIDTESCPFNPGDTVTSPGGASGVVVSDSGTLIVVSNDNTATAAFSAGETVTDTNNACTAHTTANLDYFNWAQFSITGPIAIDLSAQVVGDAGTVTALFLSTSGHTLGNSYLIQVTNLPLFRLRDSNGANRFTVGNDGVNYSYNALGGAQFISDDGIGLFCHGDCETVNTGARVELNIDQGGGTWNWQVRDASEQFAIIDQSTQTFQFGPRRNDIIFDANSSIAQINVNNIVISQMDQFNGDYHFGDPNKPSFIQISTPQIGNNRIILGDSLAHGNELTATVDDTDETFIVHHHHDDGLNLDFSANIFKIGNDSASSMGKFDSANGITSIGDAFNNGNANTIDIDDPSKDITIRSQGFAAANFDGNNRIYYFGEKTTRALVKVEPNNQKTTIGDAQDQSGKTKLIVDDSAKTSTFQDTSVNRFQINGNRAVNFGGYAAKTQYTTPATGGTISVASSTETLIIHPAGAILTLTINFPSSPVDGQTIHISADQKITTITYGNGTISGGGAAGAVGLFTGGTGANFVFSTNDSLWHLY